jgi:predicted RecA/RadA family phage recombinase
MDPRQHVNPGDPIRLAASQINGLNRLLNVNAGFGSPAAAEQPTPYTWVMAKNNTGSNIERWGVLAITGMDITPGSGSNSTHQFEQLPVVAGGTPSDTTTAWCVAVEPIKSGKIGRVAVGGVVQLKTADLGKASGAHVLWKDSTWALIRIQSGVVRGTFSGAWAKGSTTTVTDSVNTGITYSGVKNYLSSFSGTGTLACEIAYVGSEWVLVSAESLELDVVTGVTLESSGIKITKETVYVIGKKTPKPADTTIGTTACT